MFLKKKKVVEATPTFATPTLKDRDVAMVEAIVHDVRMGMPGLDLGQRKWLADYEAGAKIKAGHIS